MVTNQASMKRDGVQDYVSLRATAAIIFAYSIFMAWYFITSGNLSYVEWRGLFSGLAMKVFTLAALISVMIHVRIGLWQVLSDYVKPSSLRAGLQYILNIIAFGYVAVGLFVLWGV